MRSGGADRALVRRARGGDRVAFAVLIERHYPILLSSCRRAVRDAELARDAAQQAVLTAMLGLHRLRDEDRFAAWLIGIGLNVCRTFIAAQARTVPCPELVNDHARALALAGLTHAEIAEELSTRSGADADLDWCDGGHSLCRDPRKRRASATRPPSLCRCAARRRRR